MHEFLAATLTSSTCGYACWRAKQPECNCSCGGKNHGIYNVEGSASPERTRQVKGQVYKLVSVHEGYSAACAAEREAKLPFYAEARGTQDWWRHPFTRIFMAAAAAHQLKWPEFQGIDARRAYGLWVPVELTS